MPYPMDSEGEAGIEGISRRMEAVVISFGLRPMFGVTCRPRAVSTRYGMSGSRTSTCSPSSPFASLFLWATPREEPSKGNLRNGRFVIPLMFEES